MTPAGETVGDVSSRRRSWRRGYGPAVARRSLRAIRPSRAGRRGVGDGSRGRGDGGSSSKAGDDVVGLRGFRVGGGVAGVAGAVSDAVGALGAEVPAVEAFVGGGFDTSFGLQVVQVLPTPAFSFSLSNLTSNAKGVTGRSTVNVTFKPL
ncbi:hypothetical protein PF006_g1993 [Phytophthora fragariae]|uniref:Uncharacterized protein n=1 Tax=Phytophthora fragariae TaxID=53985 RepID=A0A6A3URK6_9STRA|nr:hypothetical protein PF006_g1993 [Phytophthora fragariae]